MLSVSSTFKIPDQKTISISLVGVVPEAISEDARNTIADGIISLIRENGVAIENAMISINEITN